MGGAYELVREGADGDGGGGEIGGLVVLAVSLRRLVYFALG